MTRGGTPGAALDSNRNMYPCFGLKCPTPFQNHFLHPSNEIFTAIALYVPIGTRTVSSPSFVAINSILERSLGWRRAKWSFFSSERMKGFRANVRSWIQGAEPSSWEAGFPLRIPWISRSFFVSWMDPLCHRSISQSRLKSERSGCFASPPEPSIEISLDFQVMSHRDSALRRPDFSP